MVAPPRWFTPFFLEMVKLHFSKLSLNFSNTAFVVVVAQHLKTNFKLPWDVNKSYKAIPKVKSTLKQTADTKITSCLLNNGEKGKL